MRLKCWDYVSFVAASSIAGIAGCIGGGSDGGLNPPSNDADDHESHGAELEVEIERRGVAVNGWEHDDGVVRLVYASEDVDEVLAEVSMAFV